MWICLIISLLMDMEVSFPIFSPIINSALMRSLFIYLAVLGLNCVTWDLCYTMWDLFFRLKGCLVVAWGLSCTWDLSSPIRDWTMSATLQGRFLTTGPPGKSPWWDLWTNISSMMKILGRTSLCIHATVSLNTFLEVQVLVKAFWHVLHFDNTCQTAFQKGSY